MAPVLRKRPATYADLLALPEHLVGEIIDGELIASARPANRHARTSSILGMSLGPFGLGSGEPGGWWIIFEPELHLSADVLVPDLAGWRRERMPEVPDEPWFALAPDWVCEVLSPSTMRLDRQRKLGIYGRERVGHLWLLDPGERTLEAYRLTDNGWLLLGVHGDPPKVRVPPFEALELDLELLWGPAPPE